MTDADYIRQLEEDNALLRRHLEATQEDVDYMGAKWVDESPEDDKTYALCLGHFCLGFIRNTGDTYTYRIFQVSDIRWKWSEPHMELTLADAKEMVLRKLGFGKKKNNMGLAFMETENKDSTQWMMAQVKYKKGTT